MSSTLSRKWVKWGVTGGIHSLVFQTKLKFPRVVVCKTTKKKIQLILEQDMRLDEGYKRKSVLLAGASLALTTGKSLAAQI